ncbi:MAG: aspartate/glutamate racemase, partial [Acidimicrobiia bacterium]|nr:aspartate/glutamate racemase [Acidimicrobiia bacterium]
AGRTTVHDVIYHELVQGIVTDSSRDRLLAIIGSLIEAGAGGVVAGCTEIELLVTPADIDVPYFPTARLHAEAAVAWALET